MNFSLFRRELALRVARLSLDQITHRIELAFLAQRDHLLVAAQVALVQRAHVARNLPGFGAALVLLEFFRQLGVLLAGLGRTLQFLVALVGVDQCAQLISPHAVVPARQFPAIDSFAPRPVDVVPDALSIRVGVVRYRSTTSIVMTEQIAANPLQRRVFIFIVQSLLLKNVRLQAERNRRAGAGAQQKLARTLRHATSACQPSHFPPLQATRRTPFERQTTMHFPGDSAFPDAIAARSWAGGDCEEIADFRGPQTGDQPGHPAHRRRHQCRCADSWRSAASAGLAARRLCPGRATRSVRFRTRRQGLTRQERRSVF